MTTDAGLDWKSLGFTYRQTKSHIVFSFKNGEWDAGNLNSDPNLHLHLDCTALHYGQTCFEGLKAFRMADGKIRIFRPQLNARRLVNSCQALSLPAPPESLFLDAIQKVVQDNAAYVPPYGSNGSLYIRPFVLGSQVQIGLSPSQEALFIVFVNPVGDYYTGGIGTPVKALIQHGFDRAAPNGTGNVKVGGNYAPCLVHSAEAKKDGYAITLFLDAQSHSLIEEFSSSNFAALTKPGADGTRVYVTPRSKSILPSVTNRSLTEIARRHFGWKIERRDVPWTEVLDGGFEEIVACGTAAIMTPIGEIHRQVPTGSILSPLGRKNEPRTPEEEIWEDEEQVLEFKLEKVKISSRLEGFKELYKVYRALQTGDLENWQDYNWMWPAEGIP